MSISYADTGRTRQKARTREALVAATRRLLARGELDPTVEQAADEALVSRATAYRYFPNRRALLAAAYPELEEPSLVTAASAEGDVEARLDEVLESLTRQLLEHEAELRTMLRLSLEPEHGARGELPLRTGRALRWIEDALAPLQGELPRGELRRLSLAIRCAVGIESLVWLTDVAGVSRRQAVEVMGWSARALLRSARGGASVRREGPSGEQPVPAR